MLNVVSLLIPPLTIGCIDSKRSNDMMYMEPNEKLHKLCNQVLWEVIYAYFYN